MVWPLLISSLFVLELTFLSSITDCIELEFPNSLDNNHDIPDPKYKLVEITDFKYDFSGSPLIEMTLSISK